MANTTIDSLKCANRLSWDMDIIQGLFSDYDVVVRIQVVPICRFVVLDKWYWAGERRGHHLVRNGYKMLMPVRPNVNDSPSLNWKSIWGLHMPSKVKITIWRAMSHYLRGLCELCSRQVDVSAGCPLCHSGPEDAFHMMVQCVVA